MLSITNINGRFNMLTDFFKLNETVPPVRILGKMAPLTELLSNSNDLRNIEFHPSTLKFNDVADAMSRDLDATGKLFEDKTFTNVSFSKTIIEGIVFRNCAFIDCLFIDTTFVDCEFHDCSFKDCNPYKIAFHNTYIDPTVFEGMVDKVKYSNIGVQLFQSLYKNSSDMAQRGPTRAAQFNLNKWQRYVLDHKYPGLAKLRPKCLKEWLPNMLFYVIAGYGIRAKFLLAWAFLIVIASTGINYLLWESLSVIGPNGSAGGKNLTEVAFYTATTLAAFGNLHPGSDVGKLVSMVETGFGLIVVALFLTWLVRLALR